MNRCILNKNWLRDEEYSEWLQEVPNDKYAFRCRACAKNLELGRMGKAALSRHKKSSKHSELVKRSDSASVIKSWTSKTINSLAATTSEGQPESQNTSETADPAAYVSASPSSTSSLVNWGITDQIFKSEILWAIQTTVNHNSHTSNRNTSCLFEVMFPDSPIAQKFSCGSDETSYLVNFGLAPFFSEELIRSVTDASCFSISYDESFNSETENEQMDFCVRFWDSEKSKVVGRYLASEFLGHPNAENLLDSFVKATCKLNNKKLIQVSLDGPSVNHKFMRLLQAQ